MLYLSHQERSVRIAVGVPVEHADRRRLKVLVTSLALACTCCLAELPLLAQKINDDAVEQYLSGLGLVDLQIRQLNEMIDRPAGNRTERAKKLVNLYVDELVTDTDDAMLKKVPAARSAGLAVMLCVVDQQKAETNAERWISNPKDQKARQTAIQILKAVIPQLEKHRRALNPNIGAIAPMVARTEIFRYIFAV